MEQPRLPLFEGLQPLAVRTKLSGKTGGLRRPVKIGETVTLLVTATVAGVNHTTDKDAVLWREQTLTVEEAFELPTGDVLLEEARRQLDTPDAG
jgi:hypothetical protein